MSPTLLAPPLTPADEIVPALRRDGYAVLAPDAVVRWAGVPLTDLDALRPDWDALPLDAHLRDGGRYRRRRHACFVVTVDRVEPVAHRAHWQPVEYNALHGGLHRWFEPVRRETADAPAWTALLRALARAASALRPGAHRWFVEAHQFRIDTADGIGRPTPEGAHRDGVDLVAVMLVDRAGVKGGETRVFDADGPRGLRFTLTEPWTLLLLDDARVIHESTPVQPDGPDGHRDTLVVTLRAGAFQGEDGHSSGPSSLPPP